MAAPDQEVERFGIVWNIYLYGTEATAAVPINDGVAVAGGCSPVPSSEPTARTTATATALCESVNDFR